MLTTAPLTILVIEDNPGDFILVREYIEEGFQQAKISHAKSLKEAVYLFEEIHPDVILLDLTLPDGIGIGSYHLIHTQAPHTPIIILTGLGDTQTALESLKFGAQDYIVKDDCNTTVLSKSIYYGIERSKTLAQIKASEEQYKYLFYNNPLPMLAFEKESKKFIMINGSAINHYGYSEESFLDMNLHDLEVEKDVKAFAAQSNGKVGSYSTDLKHHKKDGTLIDVEMSTHDIVIEGRHCCLGVVHDVTERNKAKEKLRESEQMFRTISENFPNGAVAILDTALNISYIAGKDFHIPNSDASYFINTHFTDHFHPEEKEKVRQSLLEVFEGHNKVFEIRYNDSIYMISAVPLFDTDQSINKILIASQNITEQKKNEKEKELLIEELTQINNDLRQFSYITSHNLRAPLSNLLGIIKLLDTSTVTDPMNSLLLKNFEECTLQLNDTVNDLINVLIIKNNVNAKKEKLDIRNIFERVVHSIQTTVDKLELKITSEFDDAYEVEFNKTYLESILLNLLTNAIKYSSPSRKPEVHIYTRHTNEGIKLYFSDNGLGIDLDRYKDRIFGLYQRFHDHADSKGLGLYIVNSQIRVMGGEIDVESEVDKGTTFIITFKK
ncbi:MAG: hybrid sensor histidine kinase/response regulator [Segetibacter sp.]|nr:hybrid sensor histidine kinase/response regulator [Segetibacter sp.]